MEEYNKFGYEYVEKNKLKRKRNKKIVLGLSLVFVMCLITFVYAGDLIDIGSFDGFKIDNLNTISDGTKVYSYTDDNTDEDFVIKTDKQIYRTGLNSAEGYFAIKSEISQRAYIYFYNTDLTWLKKYSIETETYSVEDKCLKTSIDEKTEEETCIEWSYKNVTKQSDLWTLVTLKDNTYEYLLPIDAKTKEGTANKVAVVDLTEGQNDFRFLTEGANKEFYIEIVYEDTKYSHLDPFVNASWNYKANITLNGSMINGTHTNFPVLLTEDNMPDGIWEKANADGGDIRFSDNENGSIELAREIVSYSNTTNTTEIWVSVNLTDGTDKDIYIWYDYDDAEDYAPSDTYGAENVWNSNYLGVYHDGAENDSTSNGNDLTMVGNVASIVGQAEGKIGSSSYYDGTGDYGFISAIIPNTGSNNWTVQSWANGTLGDNDDWFSISVGKSSNYISSRCNELSGSFYNRLSGNGGDNLNTIIPDDNWYQIVMRYDDDGTDVYGSINGFYDGVRANYDVGSLNADDFYVSTTAGANYWAKEQDEVRLSQVFLSDEWINTEYNNQNNATLFATAGTGTMTEDTIPPTYECSFNQTYFNQPTQLSCVFSDALLNPNGQYNISLNNSGTWVSVTSGNFTTTPQTITYNFTLNSTIGNYICLNVTNATDTSGNVNDTGVLTCVTTTAEPSKNIEAWGDLIDYIIMKTGAILHFTPRTEPLYPCNSTYEGDMYYDSTIHNYKFCNSTAWREFG